VPYHRDCNVRGTSSEPSGTRPLGIDIDMSRLGCGVRVSATLYRPQCHCGQLASQRTANDDNVVEDSSDLHVHPWRCVKMVLVRSMNTQCYSKTRPTSDGTTIRRHTHTHTHPHPHHQTRTVPLPRRKNGLSGARKSPGFTREQRELANWRISVA
jgi:hypothetical protein